MPRRVTEPRPLLARVRRVAPADAAAPRPLPARAAPAATSPEQALIRAIESELACGMLRWARRQRLLRLAARLGIAPFEANLLIARTEHRAAPRRATPCSRGGWGAPVAIVVGAELLLLGAAAAWLAT